MFNREIRCIAFQDLNNDEWEWSAIALEMDLRGFGNTMQEARDDLAELIETQVEFATGRKELEILDHPTEQKWFDLWDKINKKEEKLSASLNPKETIFNILPDAFGVDNGNVNSNAYKAV